jgi:cytochrome c peroxidase
MRARLLLSASTLAGVVLSGCGAGCESRESRTESAETRKKSATEADVGGESRGAKFGTATRTQLLKDARALIEATTALEAAVPQRSKKESWHAYLEVRRAYRRVGPIAATLAPASSSQVDPERAHPTEMLSGVGLREIGDALLEPAPDWTKVDALVSSTAPALRAVHGELSVARYLTFRAAAALSRGIFAWGRALDGSLAEHDDEFEIDVHTAGGAIAELAESLSSQLFTADPERLRLDVATGAFRNWMSQQSGIPARRLDGLQLSGELGAAVRRAAFKLTDQAIHAPFIPAIRRFSESPSLTLDEPVHAGTFPLLRGGAPDPAHVALGDTLFHDVRLSANSKMSCATCHARDFGMRSPGVPLDVYSKPLPRDAPTIWNAAYEPIFFWDGRARNMSQQIRIAVERDMGGEWPKLVSRLREDAALNRRFGAAFPTGLTAKTVQAAIAAFERTLIAHDTPFDRYVAGDGSAMDASMLLGFDVFYGKARCSRCHQLPLTSGTAPPRFTDSEVSVIGVPTAPRKKVLDPDRGRGPRTGQPFDEHAFKVPTLRNLVATAPYFHNRSFETLADVVEFYEDGSGEGLGFNLEHFDPDAAKFELTDGERAALLVFLEKALAHPAPERPSTREH